jgi:hypothetical protein
MMISGTHRCNQNAASSCSGTTTACGSSAAYRISDIAHNDESIFQTATAFLANADSNLIFIQLHGFAKTPGDPNLIISNGTRDTPDTDPIEALRQSLLSIDASITFKIAHVHTEWTRLTGFTNTQGRYLNESNNACSSNAVSATGRFVHIEQEFDLFRKDESGWDLMSRGLQDAFHCESVSVNVVASPVYFISDHDITFENISNERYLLEIYFLDGRTWIRNELISGRHYPFPPNTICVVVVRSGHSGIPVFQKKIFSLN